MTTLSTPVTSPDAAAGHGHPGHPALTASFPSESSEAGAPGPRASEARASDANGVEAISTHANGADRAQRQVLGPRLRRLHARIGAAHRQAEGMAFSRALLAGQVEPLQLVALLRALAPGYGLIEQEGPALAAALGAQAFPWSDLARSPALERDAAQFAAIEASPPSAAAAVWLEQLRSLARQAPHRFMAHVYVRYGGDLSGGQQLAEQANAILASRGLPPVSFWAFERPVRELKDGLHAAFEQLELSEAEEAELLEEAEIAFRATQSLLAELAELVPGTATGSATATAAASAITPDPAPATA
jgi:heme oxygenase